MENHILNYIYFPYCSIILLMTLSLITYLIKIFSELCPNTIKFTAHTYFVTVYTVAFFLFVSEKLSWITENGKPSSVYGHYFLSVLAFFIDVKTEFYIILSVFSFIFVPMSLSYVVCGLAGLGRIPINIGKALRISILIYAKSLLPFSAIGIAFLGGILFTKWGKEVHTFRFIYLISCLLVTLFSSFLIFVTTSWRKILIKADISDKKIIKMLKKKNDFMMRKEPKIKSCLSDE